MPKSKNQRFKLYKLKEIMLEKTDEDHALTMPQIIKELERYDINAERKSIYTDLADLEDLGVIVESEKVGKYTYYRVIDRQFELPELKLLVDAIQSSKFITVRKTNDLIRKLESLCSEYEAKQLQRQVFVQDRIKTMNESIYYSVDTIHNAITENKRIRFKYFRWNIKKEAELTHDGNFIKVSPWALTWNNENYYLVAYDSESEKIKHYRVDKMLKIDIVDEERDGRKLFGRFNTADYINKNFSMYGGNEEEVVIELDNSICGVFIDRFGKDITFVPIDENHSRVRLKVALSTHFLGWLFALGDKVKITGGEEVLKKAGQMIDVLESQYRS